MPAPEARTSTRRRAPDPGGDAPSRARLLDVTEQLLREEGYAAVSARRLAQRAGLNNHQLIYYYFRNHEELFRAVLQRRADNTALALEGAVSSAHPLRTLWELYRDPDGSWFTFEFMALSNRFESIRLELEQNNLRFRALELRIIERQTEISPALAKVPPVVLCLMVASLSRVLARETALGQTLGHAEADAFVAELLRTVDA